MTEHEGSCHCGRVRLILRETPADAGECDCSLCRRLGALWHHCRPAAVRVEGQGANYVQGDGSLRLRHCPNCGCTTHWSPIREGLDRMAVNLRLFGPALWAGLPRRPIDGASF